MSMSPSNVPFESSTTSRGRQSTRSEGKCRTCTSCRKRKIKCDSRRPVCTTCGVRGYDCEYPHDARKTATRTRKDDVRLLHKQLEEVRQQLRDKTSGEQRVSNSIAPSVAPAHVDNLPVALHEHVSTAGSHQNSPTSSIEHARQSLQKTNDGLSDCPVSYSSDSLGELTGSTLDEGLQMPISPGQGKEAPSLQVYGATSLLHDQTSRSPLAFSSTTGMEVGALSEDAMRDRLISYAAIRRQEEIILLSSPSITANIDFDGVPMDTAMHLLDLHWNRQHLSYLITYRPAIMDSLVKNGPYVNNLLLNAIYFQSSLYSNRISVRSDPPNQTVGVAFYDRFKALLAQYIDVPSMPTVVALLTCGACLVPHGRQSAGWVLCGMAYRMITDLGCHLDIPHNASDTGLTAIDMEIRKRVYWGAYVGDKFQSLFLGRPPAMLESAGKVSREYLDSYEELEVWKPYVDPLVESSNDTVATYPGRPSYALSTFRCLLQLCDIAARIIDAFYSINSAETPPETLLQTRHDIREQLSQWKHSLPLWLQYDPSTHPIPPPHQITPHTTYWTLTILTEQAFLNRGRFNFTLEERCQEEARQRCLEAAFQIWKLVEAYRDAFTLRRAQYGISYATYCAALVILQQTDKEYIGCLRFFWHALVEYQRGCSYGLKRPLRLLKSLMHRLETVVQEVNVEDGEVADWQDLGDFQIDLNSAFQLESLDTAAVDAAGGPSLGANANGRPSSHGNTIFDITDDTIYGFYM